VPSKSFTASGVVCLVGGSLAVLVQYLVTPVSGSMEIPELLDRVAEHHTAMAWALGLDFAVLLVVPAVLFVGYLAGSRTSSLAGVATALCFVPAIGAVVLVALDVLMYEASVQPDRDSAVELVRAYQNNFLVAGLTVCYLVTHAVGFVMLGIALRRNRAVPLWAVVAIASWPLVEMAGYAIESRAVATVGYGLLSAGYAACAVELVNHRRAAASSARVATEGAVARGGRPEHA
jgi:hypothetical protein